MLAIIDYDAGNLRSVEKAFALLGETPVITRDPQVLLQADKVVLPGVGAFGDAMEKLHQYELVDIIKKIIKNGVPFLGICLGMQLLFETSEESPGAKGLGVCKGKILRIPEQDGLKVPHMGWNSLHYDHPGRLYRGIPENSYVYFVHSYYLKAEQPEIVVASADYAANIHASIEQGNVFGCQFHPEKSSDVGLAILKNFIELEKEKM